MFRRCRKTYWNCLSKLAQLLCPLPFKLIEKCYDKISGCFVAKFVLKFVVLVKTRNVQFSISWLVGSCQAKSLSCLNLKTKDSPVISAQTSDRRNANTTNVWSKLTMPMVAARVIRRATQCILFWLTCSLPRVHQRKQCTITPEISASVFGLLENNARMLRYNENLNISFLCEL
jgi:hypothetical protein